MNDCLADVFGWQSTADRAIQSPPKSSQPLVGVDAEREPLAIRVVLDAREFAKRLMKMLRPDADAALAVEGQCLRVDVHPKLALISCPDDAVAADAAAEEHDRADRP